MEIRNNSEALNVFLGVSASESSKSKGVRSPETDGLNLLEAGDRATLSGMGTAMQAVALEDTDRLEKIAAVQQAINAGTYAVPASRVADKVIESMLGIGVESKV